WFRHVRGRAHVARQHRGRRACRQPEAGEPHHRAVHADRHVTNHAHFSFQNDQTSPRLMSAASAAPAVLRISSTVSAWSGRSLMPSGHRYLTIDRPPTSTNAEATVRFTSTGRVILQPSPGSSYAPAH